MYYYNYNHSLYALLAIASIPVFILLGYIYVKDNKEKEPVHLLISLVIFGAIATVLAFFAEMAFGAILETIVYEYDLSQFMYLVLENFVCIALVEEFLKYRAMIRKTWFSLEFNSLFDGIVYAVYTSLGFALAENILYVFNYGFDVGILRAFTAVPGHCCFGIIMGTFYGYAKKAYYDGNASHATFIRTIGLIAAVLAHGMYDYLASIPDSAPWLYFTIGMFIVSFLLATITSKKDHYID